MKLNQKVIDISPTLSAKIAVFPGDTAFEESFLMQTKKGDHLTLSWVKSTVHLGAHADAPNHYHADGQGIETRDLSRYLGLCQVIETDFDQDLRIRLRHIKNKKILAPKILFKTKSFPDPNKWKSDFAALSEELVMDLHKKGVHTVGIDTPSIDPAEDKKLESHQAVYRCDMSILEGLVLDQVSEGLYDLIALPLKIAGADASPVRAVLLSPPSN